MIITLSTLLAPVFLVTGQISVAPSADFPKEVLIRGITATVRVRNLPQNAEGSGVLIEKSASFIYVLTAHHIVDGADRLEVAVFFVDSYPKPKVIYRSAEIVAKQPGLADLALLRLPTVDKMPSLVRLCPVTLLPTGPEIPAMAIGCDAGKAPSCLLEKLGGKKSARRPEGKETSSFWEVDRKHVLGRSGGPLIDGRGYLLGICSGSNREKTYFTHIEEIHKFLKSNGFRWLTVTSP